MLLCAVAVASGCRDAFDMPAIGGNRTIYRVVFTATDRGGLTGRKVVDVLITP